MSVSVITLSATGTATGPEFTLVGITRTVPVNCLADKPVATNLTGTLEVAPEAIVTTCSPVVNQPGLYSSEARAVVGK